MYETEWCCNECGALNKVDNILCNACGEIDIYKSYKHIFLFINN